MIISNRTKIAVEMLYTIGNGCGDPVTLATVANTINVSVSYLEQLSKHLRNHGLIITKKGVNGGNRLAERDISIMDVANAVQVGEKSTGFWQAVSENIETSLAKVYIQKL